MDKYELLVAKVDDRLRWSKFRIWRKVSIVELLDTDLFATRVRWRLARDSHHLIMQFKVAPKVKDFTELFDEGLRYARKAYPTPLPIQLGSNYNLVGCIATYNVTQELIEFVTRRPGSYWRKRMIHGYFQLPVLIDLDADRAYYYRGVFCRSLRKFAEKFIESSIESTIESLLE
jgi:hypothetical protein